MFLFGYGAYALMVVFLNWEIVKVTPFLILSFSFIIVGGLLIYITYRRIPTKKD